MLWAGEIESNMEMERMKAREVKGRARVKEVKERVTARESSWKGDEEG